jgi:PAS domain S-box-containing protein
MEAAPDGMVVVNQGGEIVLLNVQAEKQFGYRRDELLGQKVKNIIPEGFAERLIADALRTTAEALAQQIGTGIELHGRRKDGTVFPIEIMLSPLESAEGILVTAAIRDISERKQLARQLHQSQKMEAVGQLTGGIAHDFNNLLGVIIGNLDLLDRLVAGNEAAVKASADRAKGSRARRGHHAAPAHVLQQRGVETVGCPAGRFDSEHDRTGGPGSARRSRSRPRR